jgi:hypothetical protein
VGLEVVMFLKLRQEDEALVEVLDLTQLFDPFAARVLGRFHAGEEMQEPEPFGKADLQFPSGEGLPRCWVDPDYRKL